MWRRAILIPALILAGCAGTFKQPGDLYNPPLAEYPFQYGSPYVNMYWRCQTAQAGGVSVDGYAMASSNANLQLNNFNVTLSARNAEGKDLTERFAWGDNLAAGIVAPVPFEVSVSAPPGTARYDLYYDFTVKDGFERREIFWTIKDVCGDYWRRKAQPPGPPSGY